MSATVTTEANQLTADRLRALGQTFFATRGEGVALEIPEPIEALIATVWVYRNQLSATVRTLPEAAFAESATAADGDDEEPWTAGQIVDHVVRSQRYLSTPAVRAFIERDGIRRYVSAAIQGQPEMLSRSDALTLLAIADDELAALHDEIPIRVIEAFVKDTSTIVHDTFFGTLTLKTMLLLMAMHESSHLRQLRELGA